ncbi:hypothetical protein AB0L06_41925 [Spirillospora sp. NPDC052269]
MPSSTSSPHDDWNRLRPEAVLAVKDLLGQLESDSFSQDIFDVYLYAKHVLADAMKARIKIDLDRPCDTFHNLRRQLRGTMEDQYGDRVPAPYLSVPYGSPLYEKLFLILLQRQGSEVPADLLRLVTQDSVHTERRVRELRELGLDIRTRKVAGANTYRLDSLDLDISFIPRIIVNTARDKQYRFMAEAELKEILGIE